MNAAGLIRTVERDGSRIAVSLSGGHVTSWIPAGGGEVLFLSRQAVIQPGSSIRGGVPVIFPQFADLGPLPKHGFARTAMWAIVDAEPGDTLTLRLRDDERTRAIWPHRFALSLGIRVGADQLRIALRVQNASDASFEFTCALHTYLRVGDIGDVSVDGLENVRFRDKTADGRYDQHDEALEIGGLVDSVYERAPDAIVVRDGGNARAVDVRKSGFADCVVWNPCQEGAAALSDMADDEYREMLCVEAAQVADLVHLAPGERWEGLQELTVRAA